MKKIVNILSVLLVIFVLASCKYTTITPDVPPPNVPVYYKADIQPIFNVQCTRCHHPGGATPDLTAANSYNDLMKNNMVIAGNASESILYQEVSTGGMSAYCDSQSAGLIKNWINQGALNN